MAHVAEKLGHPLMPWQRQVVDVGLELLPDGRPAYREVAFTVPRQSGKTSLILAWEVHCAIGWAQLLGPQRITYSAQTGNDARKKFTEDQFPILEPRATLLGIRKMTQGVGSESVVWTNGSRIGLLAATPASGHGKTVDLAVEDELFWDVDMHRDQAFIPAMSTRAHAQMLIASTMGTADSIALNAKVAQGRVAVEAGNDTGVAYFEWSAHPDEDPADPKTWRRCMPALGLTVGQEAIEHAYRTMQVDEFKRAFLNIATMADERVIPQTSWDLVNDPFVEVTPSVIAFDVNPERSAAYIVTADPNQVEMMDLRPGLGWVVERCAELSRKYDVPIAYDANGPAGSFEVELLAANVPLIQLKSQDMQRAAGNFYDCVVEGRVKIRRNGELDNAVAGAAKRPVGDSWVWGRRSSRTDISPLVAATVALAAAQDTGVSVYETRNLVVL